MSHKCKRLPFQEAYERGFSHAGTSERIDIRSHVLGMYRYASWRKAKLAAEVAAWIEGYADGLIFLATLNRVRVSEI